MTKHLNKQNINKIINKQNIVFWILILLTIAQLIFIFTNSFDSRVDSTRKSDVVKQVVQTVVDKTSSKYVVTDFFIRKLAHFTEFFIFGGLLYFTLMVEKSSPLISKSSKWLSKTTIRSAITFAICVCVSLIDEGIQFFSGRHCDIMDSMLDASGSLCCILISTIVVLLVFKFSKKYK